MAKSIALCLPENPTPVVLRIAELCRRQIAERCGVVLGTPGSADTVITLAISPGVGSEGFQIADAAAGSILITGHDARGLLYGVGKFLHTSRYAPAEFTPSTWRGTSVPQTPVRGMYLATHFFNFYHDAPLEEVQHYVEYLALWGLNVLSVWFDMHHYHGIQDPAAQAMLARLKGILRAAQGVGIGTSLTFLANEAYANSPVEMRADWTAGHDGYHHAPGGHYHVELCPNKPGATELLLRWVDEKLNAFADVDLDYLWIWPYDQGGCTCAACKPWGTNGFLRMAEPIAQRFRRQFPRGKVILSTWYFDHFTDGEWAGLDEAFATPPAWVDYLLADDYGDRFPEYPLVHGAPGGLPMVGFPEISMYRATPWGGFGANPFPQHLQSLWDSAKQHLSGGFPYSEGIYEDINKAICAQFYWQPAKPAWETVREYIAYEYGPEVVDAVSQAIAILERNLPRTRHDEGGVTHFMLSSTEGVDEAWALMQQADAQLTLPRRASWRWRILYLRALIDHELAHNQFTVSQLCEEAFAELAGIYHADRAAYWVSPPTRAAILANRQA
jgi:hypothetical protein